MTLPAKVNCTPTVILYKETITIELEDECVLLSIDQARSLSDEILLLCLKYEENKK